MITTDLTWEEYRPKAEALQAELKAALDANTFELTPMEVRLRMAALGWMSDDRLEDHGWGDNTVGYCMWFSRWHAPSDGRPVNLRFHDRITGAAMSSDLSQTTRVVYKAAYSALSDYEKKIAAHARLVGRS